jgi:hypothetical protein
MIMIALVGMFVGAGLAVWFSVFVVVPVTAMIIAIVWIGGVVGGAGVSPSLVATLVAVIFLQFGYFVGSIALWFLEKHDRRLRESLPWISTLPPPPTW